MKFVRVVVGVLLLSLSSAGVSHAQNTSKPLFPIHVGTPATDQTTSLIYAVHSGMFARAGLDVTLDHGSANGAAIAAGVLGGSYDIGNSVITSLIDAHVKQIPFVIVGVGAVYDSRSPYSGMIVANDSPIHGTADFKASDGVVGLAILHDIGQLAIDKSVDESGGSTKGLQFTEIPQSAGLAAVESHRVISTELSNPILADALASGKVRLIPDLDAFGKSYSFTAYFCTKAFAAAHPDEVRTFARVLAAAATYTNAHPADTAAMLSAEGGIPLPVIQKMPRVQNGTSVNPASLQPLIDAEAKYGFIPAPFPAQELIDPAIQGK
jgi:ABC-type nitrate/sulfonate/bicarbonate transport system substrate-binding protein